MIFRRSGLLISILLVFGLISWFVPVSQLNAAEDAASLHADIEAANSSNGSVTIMLAGDIALSEALPPIIGEVVIEGDGQTISGDNSYPIFAVNGGKLTINNLTMTKGSARNGGAILLQDNAQVTVSNASFVNNSASWGGCIVP